eukprot:8239332-Karenia_brevis.AAC.1
MTALTVPSSVCTRASRIPSMKAPTLGAATAPTYGWCKTWPPGFRPRSTWSGTTCSSTDSPRPGSASTD